MDFAFGDRKNQLLFGALVLVLTAYVLLNGVPQETPKPHDIPARPPNLPPGDGSNDGWGDPWKKKEPIVPPRILPRPSP